VRALCSSIASNEDPARQLPPLASCVGRVRLDILGTKGNINCSDSGIIVVNEKFQCIPRPSLGDPVPQQDVQPSFWLSANSCRLSTTYAIQQRKTTWKTVRRRKRRRRYFSLHCCVMKAIWQPLWHLGVKYALNGHRQEGPDNSLKCDTRLVSRWPR
jgi:hypothetical protein